MITTKNYFDQVKKMDLSKLPAELQKSHSFVDKATKSGSNWTLYENNEQIRKMMDLHFELIGKLSENKAPKKSAGSSKAAAPADVPVSSGKKKASAAAKTPAADQKKSTTAKKDEGKKPAKAKKPTATKKAAPKKAAKPAPKETKRVAHFSDELRFIRRFVNYEGRSITRKALLNFTKGLQKAITERKIRKASKNGKIVAEIQEKALKALKMMQENESQDITFTFDGDWGKKVKEVANAEVIYLSIPLIKRFISMMGEKPSMEKVERLKKAITSAMFAKKTTSSDIYYKQLKEILETLNEYIEGKRSNLKIKPASLSGLEDEIQNLTETALEEVQEVGK
jgi:hypothetical protein